MMHIHCTHCGSENVQKASVIYEGGTSQGTSFSGGSFGGRGGAFTTVSSTQTSLAKKLKPPPRMGIPGIIGCVLGIAFTGLLMVSQLSASEPWWLYWLFMMAVLVFVLLRGLKRNKVYPEKIQAYNKMWFCQKCGEISHI
mgnify:CR=1 FL=1